MVLVYTIPPKKCHVRKRLAEIRCLKDTITRLTECKPPPEALCYICKYVKYSAAVSFDLKFYSECSKGSLIDKKSISVGSKLILRGEERRNGDGLWCRVHQIENLAEHEQLAEKLKKKEEVFILIRDEASIYLEKPPLVRIPGYDWSMAVYDKYVVKRSNSILPRSVPADKRGVGKLMLVPNGWTIEHDRDLAQFACTFTNTYDDNLDNYVESISVSSSNDGHPQNCLKDKDIETFWESDGSTGKHWIQLNMKKNILIKKLVITVNGEDRNYIPHQIIVTGRDENETQKELNEVYVDDILHGFTDVCVLENMKTAYDVIIIWFKSCKEEGCDTRIYELQIKMNDEKNWKIDNFDKKNLMRYPKLDCYDPEILFSRATLLHRIVTLFDDVLPFILPDWQYSIGTFDDFKAIRELLLLSTKRNSIIDGFLRKTASSSNEDTPKLFVNRQIAIEHKDNPSEDGLFKNSLFMQIFEALQPKDKTQKRLHYRWQNKSQWWECKFFCEGIIDQGGGFRDSLCDISEELCPSSMDATLVLPLFIKSPNQNNHDSNMNRDCYVPNPAFKDFKLYEWIGQLMGGAIRSKESLILSLPQFVWKKIAGEKVTWYRDFSSVNHAEVRSQENMLKMDEESYDVFFKEELIWATTTTDGSVVEIKPGGINLHVQYDERVEYMDAVKDILMNESNEQIAAIRKGLLSVIPQAVLDLFTWQEMEKKVCGDPEISLGKLKQCTQYHDIEEASPDVKTFWDAITIFSNEDRSKFLRFVTGRRRLPAWINLYPGKGDDLTDSLPVSATCSFALYLPHYSSVDVAVQKIRYAAYNCVAIDTDTY